jgi:hypothetical protein
MCPWLFHRQSVYHPQASPKSRFQGLNLFPGTVIAEARNTGCGELALSVCSVQQAEEFRGQVHHGVDVPMLVDDNIKK